MKGFLGKYYGLIPLILLCAFYTYKAIDFPVHDFSNYYFGGKFLADGKFNSTIYFPYEFNKAISNLGYFGLFTSYAPNTPFLALVFYPISFLSLATAKLVFNSISVVLFIYSLNRLVLFYKINPKYILLVPILFFVPIKNELLFGQVYFLLFFLLSEFWLAYEKEQSKKTALFLGFAIFLKVFPILLIFIFLFKKQFKPLIYIAISCLLLFLVTGFFTGFDIWSFYFKSVLTKASNGEIAGAFVDNYQSIFMFLKRLMVFDATENPNAFFNYPVLFSVLVFALKIGLLITGYFVCKKESNSLFVFSYWILTTILISPYGSTYTFILLLFPFLVLAKSDISNVKKVVFLSLLLLINNLPLDYFTANRFPFSYLRLFALALFFILFLSLIYRKINWKIITLSTVISCLLIALFKKLEIENSTYFLHQKTPILVYDYKINNNQLTYFYWNENGQNAKLISFEIQNSNPLKLKENQVFYNKKQLTFDKDNKLKPMLINENLILYLSDYDRGIGFYTLRKINLQ